MTLKDDIENQLNFKISANIKNTILCITSRLDLRILEVIPSSHMTLSSADFVHLKKGLEM